VLVLKVKRKNSHDDGKIALDNAVKMEVILTPMDRVATPPATKASIGLKLRDMMRGSFPFEKSLTVY